MAGLIAYWLARLARLRGSEHSVTRKSLSRILPWLVVGPALYTRREYEQLPMYGVTHVIDLRSEGADDPIAIRSLDAGWLHLRIPDGEAPNDAQFQQLMSWLHETKAREGVVYLHCEGGQGRTSTVATALMICDGLSLREAYARVLTARPGTTLSRAQHMWITAFSARLLPALPDGNAGTSGHQHRSLPG